MAFPTIVDKNNVAFYVNVGSELNANQNPPDPYCLRLLRDSDINEKIKNTYRKIIESDTLPERVVEEMQSITSLQGILSKISQKNLKTSKVAANKVEWSVPIPKKNIKLTSDMKISVNLLNNNSYRWSGVTIPRVKTDVSVDDIDLNGDTKPLRGKTIDTMITDEWKTAFYTGAFNDIGYNTAKLSSKTYLNNVLYSSAKTFGYYQLMGTMSKVDRPLHVYFMLSNANAPSPIHSIASQ